MESNHRSPQVTEARAIAQHAKLDVQAQTRKQAEAQAQASPKKPAKGKRDQQDLLSRRRALTTIERAIADYLADHEGGNHSPKTVQWHQTALGLLRQFLEDEREMTLIGEVDAPDISA